MELVTNHEKLIVLGARKPTFAEKIPVGQLNLPEWERVEKSFSDLFERQYYTNHGPLSKDLEQKLERFLGVKNAILVTNATLGLAMAALALKLKGQIILPSFSFAATAQSMTLAGLSPIFCDVDENGLMTLASVKKVLALPYATQVTSVLGVHLWGNSCHSQDLQDFCDKKGLTLFHDAAQAMGCTQEAIPVAQLGKIAVFSLHATKIVGAGEGGILCTDDDILAEELRNIRSSYGVRQTKVVPYTGNGRFSEAQAAMALLSLEDYDRHQARNQKYFYMYSEQFKNIPGLRVIPCFGEKHNYQYFNIAVDEKEFGLSRDQLLEVLHKENVICRRYFYPPIHLLPPYNQTFGEKYNEHLPLTQKLSHQILQLPNGFPVREEHVSKIGQLIVLAHTNASQIKRNL